MSSASSIPQASVKKINELFNMRFLHTPDVMMKEGKDLISIGIEFQTEGAEKLTTRLHVHNSKSGNGKEMMAGGT